MLICYGSLLYWCCDYYFWYVLNELGLVSSVSSLLMCPKYVRVRVRARVFRICTWEPFMKGFSSGEIQHKRLSINFRTYLIHLILLLIFSPSVPFSLSNVWLIFRKCYIWKDSLHSKELFLKGFVWYYNITFWRRRKRAV